MMDARIMKSDSMFTQLKTMTALEFAGIIGACAVAYAWVFFCLLMIGGEW